MPGPCSDSQRRTSHHLHTKHITDSLEAASNDVVTTLRHLWFIATLRDLSASYFPMTSQNRSVHMTPQSYVGRVWVVNACVLCLFVCRFTSDDWFTTAPAHTSASVLFPISTRQSVCCQGLNSTSSKRTAAERTSNTLSDHLGTLHFFPKPMNIFYSNFRLLIGRKPTNFVRKFLWISLRFYWVFTDC